MTIVRAQPGQTTDQVIRAFQKKVLAEEILEEAKKHEFYQKPALIRKAKRLARRQTRRSY